MQYENFTPKNPPVMTSNGVDMVKVDNEWVPMQKCERVDGQWKLKPQTEEPIKLHKGRTEALIEVFSTETSMGVITEMQVLMGTGNGIKVLALIHKAMDLYAKEYAKGTR